MPILRQINKPGDPKDNYWALLIRGGRHNTRCLILDGNSTPTLYANSELYSQEWTCSAGDLELNGYSSTNKIKSFPLYVKGPPSPQSINGVHQIDSINGTPIPLALSQIPAPLGSTNTPTHTPMPTTSSSSGSSKPKAASPAKSRIKPPMISRSGVPIITVDKIALYLDAIPVNRSIMFWGPPGVGKSEAVRSWCEINDLKLYDVRLPLLDPIDLRGIGVPDLGRNQCRWLPPEFIPNQEKSVLFLDEISAATPAVQAAAYQLTLDRRIGEMELPPDCRVIAAGNRESDQSISYQMPSPLANRFIHFEIGIDVVSWRKWALQNQIDPRIISFLILNPQSLCKIKESNSGQAWPSPRSWGYASEVLKSTLNVDYMGAAVAACVGGDETRALITHINEYEKMTSTVLGVLNGSIKPTPERDPSKCQIMAISLISNAEDTAGIDKAIRWGLSQNQEWTSLLVRGMEEKFGISNIESLPSYQEYLNPKIIPNPTNAPRDVKANAPIGVQVPF